MWIKWWPLTTLAFSLCSQNAECQKSPHCANCCSLWALLASTLCWALTLALSMHLQWASALKPPGPPPPPSHCQWFTSHCTQKIEDTRKSNLMVQYTHHTHPYQSHSQTSLCSNPSQCKRFSHHLFSSSLSACVFLKNLVTQLSLLCLYLHPLLC